MRYYYSLGHSKLTRINKMNSIMYSTNDSTVLIIGTVNKVEQLTRECQFGTHFKERKRMTDQNKTRLPCTN